MKTLILAAAVLALLSACAKCPQGRLGALPLPPYPSVPVIKAERLRAAKTQGLDDDLYRDLATYKRMQADHIAELRAIICVTRPQPCL